MKAAYFRRHGGPEVMEYGEMPDPQPGPGEILVDVHAASVNAADNKVRVGHYMKLETFPYIPGRDFSGVVAALGPGATDWRLGDPVFGVCEIVREAAYAEKVAIAAAAVARKPDALSHVECAAIALTGLTALVSIEDTLRLAPGEKILIQGGAGGVAGFAIQLARHIGAHVVTTASAANHDYVRSLGADEVVDYRTQDFTRVVADCDAVFDTVGGEVAQRCFAVLKPGGRAAFIASGKTAPVSPRQDVRALRPQVARDRPHLERILELVASGAVRLPEITVFPLAEVRRAHEISESRHLRGKLVLQVRAE